MEEQKIEIYIVPKAQLGEDKDMIRITTNGQTGLIIGWGYTLQEAINNFDKVFAG
jgi:TRAP-type C4-dicarboxylate transport system substrate-binding protein